MIETIKINNKYELSHDNGTNLKCSRNGEPWRDLTGDNLVLAMFQRIQELEEELEEEEELRLIRRVRNYERKL